MGLFVSDRPAARVTRRWATIALGAAFVAASTTARAEDEPVFHIEFNDGKVSPQRLEVPDRRRFKLELHNVGKEPAEFESKELRREKVLAPGATSTLVIPSGLSCCMVFVGRLWCGVLCPEGSVSGAVSAASRGHAVPRSVKWKGWPFAAFACTIICGQMVSVYQYPKPAFGFLGFSTLAAIATAYFWGRNQRVWCRYLCPVSGVFAILSKLAPVHFRVSTQAWDAWRKPPGCAPLVPIRTMRGGSACHICGRCSGFHDAVTLARRSPNDEIVHVAGSEPRPVESLLILFGLLGMAAGAFHWGSGSVYIDVKQAIAGWLVEHGITWPLKRRRPGGSRRIIPSRTT